MTPEEIKAGAEVLKAIPESAWTRTVKTACDTFESVMSPVTSTTSGVGRLIDSVFKRLIPEEQVLVGDTFISAENKANASGESRNENPNLNIILTVIEQSSRQTDKSIRELWSNLLARELTIGDIHPEVAYILSRIGPDDAKTLVQIANRQSDLIEKVKMEAFSSLINLGESLSRISLKGYRAPVTTFSEKVLETLNLIEKKGDIYYITALGSGFIESVT
ncbi:MAG: hypothetical protein ACJAUR_000107 [Ulvibacter sp.]|jgi:hypothetical protein